MGYSIRSSRYRYTEWRDFKTRAVIARELYDHKSDPAETYNLAGEPRRNRVLESLARELGKVVK
jgi:iduronate 2-sulfatase